MFLYVPSTVAPTPARASETPIERRAVGYADLDPHFPARVDLCGAKGHQVSQSGGEKLFGSRTNRLSIDTELPVSETQVQPVET